MPSSHISVYHWQIEKKNHDHNDSNPDYHNTRYKLIILISNFSAFLKNECISKCLLSLQINTYIVKQKIY